MKSNEECKVIKLPIIKTEHNANISSTNNVEGLLSKSNSSKYLLSKNDSPEKQRTVKVLFQRNKTNVNVKKYISSTNRIRLVISNKLNEYSRSKSKENKNEKKKEKENKPDIYYYKIFSQGNDTSTVKKCFEHRINWKSEDKKEEDDKISLIWAPLSSQINFHDLGYEPQTNTMVNHFEFHNELSNKINMFTNMMIYCENKNLNVLNFLPLTIIIQYERVGFIRQFSHFSHAFYNIERFLSDVGDKKVRNKSKFRNLFYVTSPDDKIIGLRTSLFIPRTHYLGKNLWLLKAMNLNRGLGIKIINSVEDCEKYIRAFYQGNVNKCVKDNQDISQVKDNNKKVYFVLPKIKNIDNIKSNSIEDNSHKNNLASSMHRKIDYTKIMKNTGEKKGLYKSNKIILQKYIEKPLLYNGRKFDVRLWVLLTHTNEIYLFREGHLKATSFNYTSESTDLYIHLTNYSVQKYSDKFQKFECGNEISFDELQESLNKYYNLNLDVRQELLPKLKNIIFISMESVKKIINKHHRKNCFEIFGYDFMFDADLNPFLIEINTNPGLEISSPLIKKLVPRMIDDAFRLTIDAKFNTKYSNDRYNKDGNYISPFHVDGYNDSENIYELIGNIKK